METLRTVLRRQTPADFSKMRELETHPDIMKFTPARVPQSEDQTRIRLAEQISKCAEREPFGIWLAELKSTREFVGWFMLMPSATTQVELGFMLVWGQWNRGLATEIAAGLIDFARAHAGVEVVTAKTLPSNIASKRVLTKLGFEGAGSMRVPEKVFGGDVEVDTFCLRLRGQNEGEKSE